MRMFFICFVHMSDGCDDVHCPFLKCTPITCSRVNASKNTIDIDRDASRYCLSLFVFLHIFGQLCLYLVESSEFLTNTNHSFAYEQFFEKKINLKKDDNSYRIFKCIERKRGSFPRANETFQSNTRSITVWCSNDYLGLGQHSKLKQAVM
jgi:hypothetical protein